MKRNLVFGLTLILASTLPRFSTFMLAGDYKTGAGQSPRNLNTTTLESPNVAKSIEDRSYPEWVADQLAQLKEGMTLGDWKKDHPSEEAVKVRPYKFDPQAELWGDWCARTELRLSLPNGKEAARYAFFYAPSPPSDLSLPADQESDSLLDTCILGLIWITGPIGAGGGNLLARDASEVIKARFGEPERNSKVWFFGAASWREISLWRVGRAAFVSAYNSQESWPFALGVLPRSGRSLDFPTPSSSEYYIRAMNKLALAVSRTEDAMIKAGIEGTVSEQMKELLKLNEAWQNGLGHNKPDLLPERVVETLGNWLDKASTLSPLPKAAAFLAADQVLVEIQNSFKISEEQQGAVAREALTKLGADFRDNYLGGGIFYIRSWLQAARRIDPDGPIGDLAFRIHMENGFDTSGTCQNGSRQFEKVIEQGEAYLKNPFDHAAEQAVELMVAQAYSAIVALAEGLGREYADPRDYRAAAPAALEKAIDHFRSALPQAPDTIENRANWSDAWRLIAGLPPAHLRFFCVYD
jgi:hypothetical protein